MEKTVIIIATNNDTRFEFLQHDGDFHFCEITSKSYNVRLTDKKEIKFSSGIYSQDFIKDIELLKTILYCVFADEIISVLSLAQYKIVQCKVSE